MELQRAESPVLMPDRGRLSVFDLLILIAATSLGLALTRSLPDYVAWHNALSVVGRLSTDPKGGWSTTGWGMDMQNAVVFLFKGHPLHQRPSYWLGHIPYWTGPCLVSVTIASMFLSLRSPRPRLRRLARRPGMAAGLAMILALGLVLLQSLPYASVNGAPLTSLVQGLESYWVSAWIWLPRLSGLIVAVWWLALALSGRWSAERNAGGKLGQALGWCWIAMAISSELGLWCFALNC